MIIEFMGYSGAGKSTLVPILTQLLRDDGELVMSVTEAIRAYTARTLPGRIVCALAPAALRGPLLWRSFSYLISKLHLLQCFMERPQLMGYVVRSQLQRPVPRRHRWLIVRLFLRMASEYHLVRSCSQPGEVVVFDEGFVHRAVHLFVSAAEQVNSEQIVEYLSLLPHSDLVILVKAAPATCLARIQSRGLQVRLSNLTAQDIARFMANTAQVMEIASRYLQDAGWPLIEVMNDGEPSVGSTELQHKVVPYVGQMVNAVG